MKKFSYSITCLYLFLSFITPELYPAPVSNSDLWEMNNISSISSSSIHPVSNVYSLFGGNLGTIEPENLIFSDNYSSGYIHWVEWTLNNPTQISDINLVATHDGADSDLNNRGFSRFVLEAYVANQWVTVYEHDVVAQNVDGHYPVYDGGTYYTQYNILELEASFTPVTAQTWEASFTRYSDAINCASRVIELDGYYNYPVAISESSIFLLYRYFITCKNIF